MNEYDDRGQLITDVNFLVLITAHHDEIGFALPACHPGKIWLAELDTSRDAGLEHDGTFAGAQAYPLHGRSFALLREMDPDPGTDSR